VNNAFETDHFDEYGPFRNVMMTALKAQGQYSIPGRSSFIIENITMTFTSHLGGMLSIA
jgi:hypothetical protein